MKKHSVVREQSPLWMRQATVDTELLEYHVLKYTNVTLDTWGACLTEAALPIAEEARSSSSLARSQRVPGWDDKEVTQLFKPERWLKVNNSPMTGRGEFDNVEYDCTAGPVLTSGAGPRGCFGKRLAYLEMMIIIVVLVWDFLDEHDNFTTMPTRRYVELERAD